MFEPNTNLYSKTYTFRYPYINIDTENKNNIGCMTDNNLTFNNRNKWYVLVQGTFQTRYKMKWV